MFHPDEDLHTDEHQEDDDEDEEEDDVEFGNLTKYSAALKLIS